ncbi:FecCD family ABC transporter permease [Falsarthrobacter nasiphocae]|uniref:Iron complex transport system permease protein n=1 Tax=Falsarthrobacter nasiphocae TaxID=189863 RepID=A0AAE4C5E0_9MICC|nr:iron chelate uptake ABC transporter family permease subunit [Falsarthrobacter nasiphocae]MDR6892251.1 iron complex transport system permease protein [Falsarthrobacter nasiphocae]
MKAVITLSVAVVALFAGCVLLGDYTVTIPDFFRILGGETIPGASYIVMESKLPKAVAALLVGLAFGLSGALFQTLLRNPLASPDIIGVNSGASTGAVLAILLWGAQGMQISGAAVAGGLLVAAVIYVLSMRGRTTTQAGGRLILIGIGLAAMTSALTSWLLTRVGINQAQEALLWMSGSLGRVTWERIGILAAALAVLLPGVALIARRLRMLELGDDLAQGLGVDVGRSRLLVIAAGVLLSALATAVVGPLAFVAFLAGPLSRWLTGRRLSLGAAALTGAVIVLGAQFLSSGLLYDWGLPVGIITAVVGAPALILLLLSGRAQSRRGKAA